VGGSNVAKGVEMKGTCEWITGEGHEPCRICGNTPELLLWPGVSAQVWCFGPHPNGEQVRGIEVFVEPDAEEVDQEITFWRPWGPEGYARTEEEAIERAWRWWDTEQKYAAQGM